MRALEKITECAARCERHDTLDCAAGTTGDHTSSHRLAVFALMHMVSACLHHANTEGATRPTHLLHDAIVVLCRNDEIFDGIEE